MLGEAFWYRWPMSANPNLVRPDRETLVRLTSTMNDRDISRLYGCTSPTVAKWRDRYGIPRSPRQSGGNTIKWQTNRNYFSRIDTPEKAYVLGLVVADGHVREDGYKLEIALAESDADLLRAVAREMNCDAPLGWMTNHLDGSRMRRLYLCGRQLVNDLNALGLFHDKSETATYPAVVPALEGHLVRGIWDGDGSIEPHQFDVVGTSAVLDGVVAAAERHTGCSLRRRMSGKNKAYHYAYGTRRDTDVLHWIYSGATIALERKQKAYFSYWTGLRSRVHSL